MSSKSNVLDDDSEIMKWLPPILRKDEFNAYRFCDKYLYGIKTSEIWKTPSLDRTKWTYYILPETPTEYRTIDECVTRGTIKPTVRDFEKFWFELSDIHKDRYLLTYYMAVYDCDIRAAIDELDGTYGILCKDLWIEKVSQTMALVRAFVMEKNKTSFRRDGALSLFLKDDRFEDLLDIIRPQWSFLKQSIFDRVNAINRKYSSMQASTTVSMQKLVGCMGTLINIVLSGFLRTYFIWVSYDAQNLRRYTNALERGVLPIINLSDGESQLNDRIDFMRKLKLAAPRWSREDRRMILDAIETDGKSCSGSYVQMLLNEVGVEKFKKLAFGKHRFCAHCHRSSYTGDDRLLACKRCDTEGVRPRAWYCDRQCQKADWRQHRASKHPTVVMVEEKAGKKKKKRKPRKK